MPWLGITAIALAGWYIFFRNPKGHWLYDPPGEGSGPWTYQAGSKQLWLVSKITLGDSTTWSAFRPLPGGAMADQITSRSLDELTTRIDSI
jgi:hypothetical protein